MRLKCEYFLVSFLLLDNKLDIRSGDIIQKLNQKEDVWIHRQDVFKYHDPNGKIDFTCFLLCLCYVCCKHVNLSCHFIY